jgi:shikimate kinase
VPASRIYLTGFMSSGKSTVGPILANVLGHEYLDLDGDIEARAGRSTASLFAEEGEAAFRRLEAEALRATGARERLVVSLGGGALASEDNLAWTLDHGTVVYLRLSADALAERLRRSRTERPLLRDDRGEPLSAKALHARIESLLGRRERFYEQAHLVIDTERQHVGETVDAVVAALRRYERQ